MAWFRRAVPSPPTAAAPAPDAGDSPEALRASIVAVNRMINSNAGRLPLRAVVAARRITDVLAEIVNTSDVRPLDVYATISVRGAVNDYLPTTLRTFLAVDKDLVAVQRPSGFTPTESLMEQLDALEGSAFAVLQAAQAQDVDALMTQGSFLRTKFSGSDLDL
ncbi:hypothetical protein [Blastococcus sp. CT_GayMR16]|uniref:hypothetical protein n=1 Tax=Blastococcus sp. CT_GayMR16 TaxID=2559607 RepID=UPI00107467A8|nr:hypothetical protein [Blastococcus sp. CT_GayMR16]TFV88578.1 hypothetical protein E4P38_10440 [Blastococcus sp. CT_GayMR16]